MRIPLQEDTLILFSVKRPRLGQLAIQSRSLTFRRCLPIPARVSESLQCRGPFGIIQGGCRGWQLQKRVRNPDLSQQRSCAVSSELKGPAGAYSAYPLKRRQ